MERAGSSTAVDKAKADAVAAAAGHRRVNTSLVINAVLSSYWVTPNDPHSFMNKNFPYASFKDYIDAFAWWEAYRPQPPLPPEDDPVALARAVAHLDAEVHRVEVEFNTEIPKVWHAADYTVVGSRVLIYGATLAIAGAGIGAAIGGPYGALIGAAVGAVVGVCMGLFPWEASSFFYNWGVLSHAMTCEERYGLWRMAHDAMNTARRANHQPDLSDGWQFAERRAYILSGDVVDLTFLCYETLLNQECFPAPPADEQIVVHDMAMLTPVARYALGVFASTERRGEVTLEGTHWWYLLQHGTTNQWLKRLFEPFKTMNTSYIRQSLQNATGDGSDPLKPVPFASFREQPIPHYVAAAIAIREAHITAQIPPRAH